MSHVSTTAHYNLPIYGGNDIINPLTDVNGTNEAIDTTMYEIAQELGDGLADIANIKNKIGDASLDTTSQNLSGAVNELKGVCDAQAGDITDIEGNVGTLQTQMATTTGNITTLNTAVASLQTDVSGKASQSAVDALTNVVNTKADANDIAGTYQYLEEKTFTEEVGSHTTYFEQVTALANQLKAYLSENDCYAHVDSLGIVGVVGFQYEETAIASGSSHNPIYGRFSSVRCDTIPNILIYSVNVTNSDFIYVSTALGSTGVGAITRHTEAPSHPMNINVKIYKRIS
jgi:hypothetical protein